MLVATTKSNRTAHEKSRNVMKRFITSLLSLGDEKEIDRHHRASAGGGFASKVQFSLDSALPAVVRHGSALPCANDH